MKPFFPPPPSEWRVLVEPYVRSINLPALAGHFHVLLGSALFYHAIFLLSPFISKIFAGRSYGKLKTRGKINWDIHVVSQVQCIIICIFAAITLICDDDLKKDKLLAYSPFGADVYAMACGYFLWDSYVSIRYINLFGPGFAVHGLASLFVFLFSFRPFVMYYGPAFLFFELSTPFLNIHYFLDKCDMTGSSVQMINGVMLMATFFFVRIVWGWYAAYQCFAEIFSRMDVVPGWLAYTYLAANTSLNFLNVYWFSKMIDALRRRSKGEKKTPVQEAGNVEGHKME
ncbi:hypothetical protein YB2330_004374 [Saitoella coloradoensis]